MKGVKVASKFLLTRHVTMLFAYLFIVWGFYRMLFQVPDPFDELLVKPAVWIIPVIILLRKERATIESIGITFKGLFPSIYLALFFGSIFAVEGLLINFFKYQGLSFQANIGAAGLFAALGISVVTAVSEEIAFRGYIFDRLLSITNNEWKANLFSATGWTLIHLPVAVFDWRLDAGSLASYLLLVFVFGFGSAFIYGKTRNIVAPILLHVLWAWPIILFR